MEIAKEGMPAHSFWHDSAAGSLAPGTPLETDITADVVIVGAGYTGLWTAYYLKKAAPALKVVILEAETAGFGASGRNGGWCSAYLSGISQWLDNPDSREDGIRLQRLMFDTVPEIGRVTREASIDCHFEQAGALEIAVNPRQRQRLLEEVTYLRALGFGEADYRLLDQAELRATLNVDKSLGAIYMPHCAAVHPARLARGLAGHLQSLAVSIYEKSPVLDIRQGQVFTERGTVKAKTIVVATEGYSGSIPTMRGRLIPVHSMMVVSEPLSDEQISDLHFKQRYCFGNLDRLVTYGQLTADNRIALGCRGTYYFGSAIRTFESGDPEFNGVRSTLIRFFPGLNGVEFTHAWGGCMGVSRTLRPSVNFDHKSQLGWAGGFFGNGVGATHLAGQTMADLVLNRDTDRVHTPWVNPPDNLKKWEPEPLRWLAIRTRAQLMHLADRAEYRDSSLTPFFSKTLDALFP